MKAKEVKNLREKLGLSQKGLAEAIGCAVSSIEHYEQGVRHPSEVFEERLQALKEKVAKLDKKSAPR